MKKTVAVVDYGMGNLRSVSQAVMHVADGSGFEVVVTSRPDEVYAAERIVLPGQGAMPDCMRELRDSGRQEAVLEAAASKPLLGVCVGMQMLADGSDEGELEGLNWIPGHVRAFSSHPRSAALPMPHMGWNDLKVTSAGGLFKGFEPSPRFYFLHSYYFECADPNHVAATSEYGFDFACVVSAGHIHGVQCHPEKSHQFGARLLRNFAEL